MEAYRHIKKIGEGAFGKALLVEDRKKKAKFVIKQVDMSKMKTREREEARRECEVLKEMRHPNIISFVKSFERGSKLHIVMDYADGGDLANKLSARRGRLLPETQALDWFVQICLALKHVHDRKILHRDLKTQNIFLTSKNIIKLGDFGIAKVLKNTRELARTQIGTPYYFSPELCDGKPYNNKSDVWSLGIVLYELCTLKYPFDGRSMQQLIMRIRLGTYKPISSTYSKELRTLLGSMLARSQVKRPSVNGILKKPLVKGRIAQFLNDTLLQEEFSHTVLHGHRKRQPLAAQNRRPSACIKKEPVKKVAPKPAKLAVQSRGPCGICGKDVRTDQDRTQDDDGKYFHIPCLRKERQQKRLEEAREQERGEAGDKPAAPESQDNASKVKLAHEDALEKARIEREKDVEEKEKYQQMLEDRHKEFLARRKQGAENKRRHQDAVNGRDKVDAAAVRRQSASERGAAPKPSARAKANKPRFDGKNAKDNGQDAAAQEYNERQRQARAYKARAKEAMHGKNPLVPDAGCGADNKAPVARRESRASKQDAADALKDAAAKEYNERQRLMREYKARAKEERNGNAAPVQDAEPARAEAKVATAAERKAAKEQKQAADDATAKAAAVQEYNDRQRKMREYKARAQDERNGGSGESESRVVEARVEVPRAPRPSATKAPRASKASVSEAPPRAPRSSASSEASKPAKAAPQRKKWGAPPKVQKLKVDPAINLGVTHVVALSGISEATTVVNSNPKNLPEIETLPKKDNTASKQRAMLRDMVKKNRALAKRRPSQAENVDIHVSVKPVKRKSKAPAPEPAAVAAEDDEPALKAETEVVSLPEVAEPIAEAAVVKACLSKVLDDQMQQVDAAESDEAEASTPEPPAEDGGGDNAEVAPPKARRPSKWGPVSNDVKVEINIQIDDSLDESFHSASSEPQAVARESSGMDDYEGMLLQLSLACSQKVDIDDVDEGGDADDDDNDSVFGDEELKSESVFGRMERVRAELEEEFGIEPFFEAFKVLRDVLSAEGAVSEVPAATENQLLAQLGGEGKKASYFRLVELVKAECGHFE